MVEKKNEAEKKERIREKEEAIRNIHTAKRKCQYFEKWWRKKNIDEYVK